MKSRRGFRNGKWLRKAVDGVVGPMNRHLVIIGMVGTATLVFLVFILMGVRSEAYKESIDVRPRIVVESEERVGTLVSSVVKGSRNGAVVVLVANYGYREFAMNTICSLRNVGLHDNLLISLDEEMHSYARKRSVPSVLFSTDKSKADIHFSSDAADFGSKDFVILSQTKTAAVLSVLKRKVPVLFVDLDVTLLKNPLPIMKTFNEDLVVTSDIKHGRDDPKNLNLRLNSGLFLARPKPAVMDAFEEIAEQGLNSNRSQQKAFNWVLCGQYAGAPRGTGTLVGNDRCRWKGKRGTATTRVMSLEQFPNGSGWPTTDAVAIHHNFVSGLKEKRKAIEAIGGW
eukprot:CAMPEP_0113969372 /NCGR_PEP_ID=MMETSP0011_2-20120614/10268_1 /TAXON_ID=101924 /ORGANISM="Rhodosorus marinus" /LENGTH=340 /DNA_ID=CAMNT_0000982997 /DNA_START=14 /DNA_END=1033 /DNA_ORIENTATION=- /assembly_acc=CAM_ASM_000156